jgi:hypothetical protein
MTDNHLTPPSITNALPYALPEKNVATPNNGFLLMPTKVAKLDVILQRALNLNLEKPDCWKIGLEIHS